MKKANSGISPTIGTLSGAEQISQSCRQSIRSPGSQKSEVRMKKFLTSAFRILPSDFTNSLSGRFRTAARFIGFLGKHHRSRSGNAAIFSNAPEVHNHQD